MSGIWNEMSREGKEEYIKYLKIFGALSGLFKDSKTGPHAHKPYLYYRNHEQLYAKVFNVEDLTRKDSAFDAVAKIDNERIGIGLKTWIHTRDVTYQKVAEFNKVSPYELAPLIRSGENKQLIHKVSELRNERVKLDQRQYNTNYDLYHNITRDDHMMNVMETGYDLVQLDSLELIDRKGGTFTFTDHVNNYKFYASKSVLLKEFNASKDKVIERIPIIPYEDPFELLRMIDVSSQELEEETKEVIYLPLYSDGSMTVGEKSGLNAWNAASKSKDSGMPRPNFEAYLPIPKWVHKTMPHFFGFNALNKEERNAASSFVLHVPDGRELKAIVTQDDGKSLQTSPQSAMGKWVVHDVLGLQAREVLTMDHLIRLGVDSVKITKMDQTNFKIELAETYAFENWKIEMEDNIRASNSRMPTLRKELFEDVDL